MCSPLQQKRLALRHDFVRWPSSTNIRPECPLFFNQLFCL
ncbi:hypothetical protein HMPREF9554_01336 [Treponema phagedenis F0421]|nr:hypothetical protein HMPREF9554_01336 [Treponema phagedenis F0421]